MSILNNLPQAVKIYSFSNISDDMGGYTRTWNLVKTTKCRLYSRQGKMIVSDRGIDNEIQTKAMFNILDRDYLVSGYKIIVDNIEYVIKRPDIIYDRTKAHHVEVVIEFYKSE